MGPSAPTEKSRLLDFIVGVRIARWGTLLLIGLSRQLRAADIDRRGVERVLDMRRIVLLDHFNAGAAVFGDLVDVGSFHEPHANVGMAQAVGRARIVIAIKLELRPRKNPIEELDVVAGEDVIRGLRQFLPWRLGRKTALTVSALALPSRFSPQRLRAI